ncbi:hypothetical protein HUB94_02365 (plasmid) [Paenibacillus cellulosilyticus]|nr:hypothetical protein HUB94_02365 [Paenibacillus cellulosilyticus]
MKQLRERVISLTAMYRALKHVQQPDGTWDWFLLNEIEECEVALTSIKTKIAAVVGDNSALQPVEWFHAVFIIADVLLEVNGSEGRSGAEWISTASPDRSGASAIFIQEMKATYH